MRYILLAAVLFLGCGGDKGVEPAPPPDLPPRAVETFGAQTLTAERDRLTIDFATAFRDPEERPLRYSAESSDTSVLTAAMSGSVLTITPLVEGSATVTVKAQDPGGNSATMTISVTVNAPPHPDDDETYLPITGLIVTANSVEFQDRSTQGSGSCIEWDPEARYGWPVASQFKFRHSRWQRQDEYGWTTVPGTERGENRLCVYTPTESGLYRMVGDVTIVDHPPDAPATERELRYRSSVLNH